MVFKVNIVAWWHLNGVVTTSSYLRFKVPADDEDIKFISNTTLIIEPQIQFWNTAREIIQSLETSDHSSFKFQEKSSNMNTWNLN